MSAKGVPMLLLSQTVTSHKIFAQRYLTRVSRRSWHDTSKVNRRFYIQERPFTSWTGGLQVSVGALSRSRISLHANPILLELDTITNPSATSLRRNRILLCHCSAARVSFSHSVAVLSQSQSGHYLCLFDDLLAGIPFPLSWYIASFSNARLFLPPISRAIFPLFPHKPNHHVQRMVAGKVRWPDGQEQPRATSMNGAGQEAVVIPAYRTSTTDASTRKRALAGNLSHS